MWARGLGLIDAAGKHDVSAVSKTWRRLEALRLIGREREGRLACVRVRHESGSGDPYQPPSGAATDWYLKLPFAYWLDDGQWYRHLALPEKAMLLIALSLPSSFTLPTEKAFAWYGISADTAQRGLHGLRTKGLLNGVVRLKEAPLAPKGFTRESHYTLEPPFYGRRRAPRKAKS